MTFMGYISAGLLTILCKGIAIPIPIIAHKSTQPCPKRRVLTVGTKNWPFGLGCRPSHQPILINEKYLVTHFILHFTQSAAVCRPEGREQAEHRFSLTMESLRILAVLGLTPRPHGLRLWDQLTRGD